MKRVKNILLLLFLFIAVLITAGLIMVEVIKHKSIPIYQGDIVVRGITSDVTIFRDDKGMPHIYASNSHDLYWATGYVMAQERLWQMDLIRRATTGRLSEIFGDNYVKTDLFLRALDMTAKSKRIIDTQDSSTLECMSAYTDGVNAFITATGKKLAPEFKILGYKPDPWKMEDIANIIGFMGWDLASGNLSADIFNYKLYEKLGHEKGNTMIPDNKAVSDLVFPDFKLSETLLKDALQSVSSMKKLSALGITTFSGSNNWAVSGTKTKTGKPVLSNDMHLGLSAPGTWIQIHQVIPGSLNVTGVAVPGEPFIVAGHNENIAWGLTNLMVDDVDLFSEKINPENPNQYYLNGEWKDMVVRKEIIGKKRGGADTLNIRFTHRGPLISEYKGIEDAALSMRWSGFDDSDELKAVYGINRASNWEEFREAVGYFKSISQNFAYADVEGNIGIVTGGGIPLRKGHGSIIRDGTTDEYDWKGYVPTDQLPWEYNPARGYVSSANNKTVDDNYPYYISFRFYPPFRISRIREMLEEIEKYGMEDFQRMIDDQHSDYAALMTSHILRLSQIIDEEDIIVKQSLDSLSSWDYNMSANLIAPTIIEVFRKSLSKNLLEDELEELYGEIPGVISDYYIYRILSEGADEWVDNITTENKESLDDILKKSFTDCIKVLSESYGDDISKWKWGNIHTITLKHPLGEVRILNRLFHLNSDRFSVGGCNHTVCPYTYNSNFEVTDGASERHIFNTADWDKSYTVIPTGNSGIPDGEFYLSQTKKYINGRFYKDPFSLNAVKNASRYMLRLKPGQ